MTTLSCIVSQLEAKERYNQYLLQYILLFSKVTCNLNLRLIERHDREIFLIFFISLVRTMGSI